LLSVSAQAAKVAVVISRSAAPYLTAAQGLKQAARFEMEMFNMEGDAEKGRQFMSGFAPEAVSLVIAIGTEAGLAAKQADPAIPVVYSMVMEAIEFPKHKAAGVVIKIGLDDQFSRVRKMFPTRRRIGVIYTQNSIQDIEQARAEVAKFDLSLYPIAVEKSEEVPDALSKLNHGTVDLLWMVPDKVLTSPAVVAQMIQHSLKENLPFIGLSMYHAKMGALAGFSVDFADVGSQTAVLAKKQMDEGARARVETPRKVIIYVNPKVQKQMGLDDLSAFPEVAFVQ